MKLPFHLSTKFLSDARWSLFSNLTGILISLATVKLVTHLVSVDVYGQVSLINGILTLLNGLLIGPIMVTHNRLLFDYRQRDMEEWYVKAFQFILNGVAVLSIFIYLIIALGFRGFSENIYWSLAVPTLCLIAVQPSINALNNYLEAQRKQKILAISGTLQKILYPLLLLLLIKCSLPQAPSLLTSQALAVIVVLAAFRNSLGYKISKHWPGGSRVELQQLGRSLLTFGWPIVLSFVTMWVITSSDKFFIRHFMTLKDVGIYAINYSLWSIPFLVINSWLEILTRPMIYQKATENDWTGVKKMIGLRALFGFAVSILTAVLLFFLSPSIASWFLSKQYWNGSGLVLTISIAYCFYVVGYSIVPFFMAAKKPMLMTLTTGVAAVVNIVANLFLIPSQGLMGAALSTLIAYIVWTVLLAFSARIASRALATAV